jgi:hypothetical protein
LLPTDAANAGAADILGHQYSPPLAVAPLLLRQLLLLLLRASASASASAIVVVIIVTAVTLQ